MQDGNRARPRTIRHVGVPDRLARAEIPHRHTLFHDVGNHQDVGKLVDEGFADGAHARRLQLTEGFAQRNQLRIADRLTADDNHQMFADRLLQCRDGNRVQCRQVNAGDFSAAGFAGRDDFRGQILFEDGVLCGLHRGFSSLICQENGMRMIRFFCRTAQCATTANRI